MNDRFDTDDIMRPYKRDYIRINVDAAVSSDYMTFAGDLGDALQADDQAAMNNLSTEYRGTEQFSKVDVGFGLWLPGWNMWNTDVLPSIRAEVTMGTLLRYDQTDGGTTINCATYGIPAEYCPGGTITTNTDFINIYAQGTGKVGLNLDFKYDEKWVINTYFYGMVRADNLQLIDADAVANNPTNEIDFSITQTQTTTINADLSVGFDDGTTRAFAGVSELRLSTVEDFNDSDVTGAKALYMGDAPVYRVHVERRFNDLFFFDLIPYAGLHNREQYEAGDGYYIGSKFIFGWQAFHMALLAQYDPEYLTATARFQLGIVDLEATIKTPHEETDDFGTKLADTIAANFRLHF
jgi:hypothetical protein